MVKRFIWTLLAFTLLYTGWALLSVYSGDGPSPTPAEKPAIPSAKEMPYSDLAAAYEALQQQLLKADSTHIIRRYHNRHALFNAERVFDERVMALSRNYFDAGASKDRIYLDLPEFAWQRINRARPVDVLRLTFRGNGIPDNVEQLAHSGLLEPKLHAFYNALIKQNTVLWKHDKPIHFVTRTAKGKLYHATSTPFIAIQRLSKDYFAKMKSASLPFLWKAYVDEEAERKRQKELLREAYGPPDLIGPFHPDMFAGRVPVPGRDNPLEGASPAAGPNLPRSQAELMASATSADGNDTEPMRYPTGNAGNVLDALPELADTMMQAPKPAQSPSQRITDKSHQPAVRSFSLNEQVVEDLFHESMVTPDSSLTDTLEWKKAINQKARQDQGRQAIHHHIGRLARLDPEFMTLFLINNLFEQYNIFSVFDEGVYLTVNAIDTRLNVLYVSYNLQFSPPELPKEEWEKLTDSECMNRTIHISDEFFLIAARPHSYLMRVYLPDCHLTPGDFTMIDQFLEGMRILH